jgi:hypothetical protein
MMKAAKINKKNATKQTLKYYGHKYSHVLNTVIAKRSSFFVHITMLNMIYYNSLEVGKK